AFGHLQEIRFVEGAGGKKGDLLFVIDQRPYKATLARADADVAQAEARVRRLERDYTRGRTMGEDRALGLEAFDKTAGDLARPRAAIRSDTAARDMARLNLEFTELRAPISGRISRAMVTVGNLVESGENGAGTLLTTIVSVDPIWAYFDVDDLTFA